MSAINISLLEFSFTLTVGSQDRQECKTLQRDLILGVMGGRSNNILFTILDTNAIDILAVVLMVLLFGIIPACWKARSRRMVGDIGAMPRVPHRNSQYSFLERRSYVPRYTTPQPQRQTLTPESAFSTRHYHELNRSKSPLLPHFDAGVKTPGFAYVPLASKLTDKDAKVSTLLLRCLREL